MVTNFKDFTRKAQNLSKIFYGIVLSTIMPVIMMTVDIDYVQISEMFIMVIAMMALVGAMPFAGAGFIESKDQLWIIQGAPSGASRFVKSRLVTQAVIGIPLILIPSTVLFFLIEMTFFELVLLLGLGYMAILGGMFIATGVTAGNPNYEDTKSPAHQANMITSVLLAEFSIIGVILVDMVLFIAFNFDFIGLIENIFGPGNRMYGMALLGLVVQWCLGGLLVWTGIKKLSSPDN